MKITIKQSEFTMAELEAFEDYTGLSPDKMWRRQQDVDANGDPVFDTEDKGRPVMVTVPATSKVMTALVWLNGRRANAEYTIEQARAVTVSELVFDMSDGPADPQEPAPAG